MEIGQTIYYQETYKGSAGYIQRSEYRGETSRSWLIGDEWRPGKLAKKTTTFKTEEDYNLQMWAHDNRWRIKEHLHNISPEQLKQVAIFIGYQEEANATK